MDSVSTPLSIRPYTRLPKGSQPPSLYEPYRATIKRAPSKPLIVLPHTLSEITGPIFGHEKVGEKDNDLTCQHAGEPIGERIIVSGHVLDSNGRPVSTIAGPNIQGPWDMTAVSSGPKTTLFVSNVLNGGAAKGAHVIDNSTVLRIGLTSGPGQRPKVLSQQVIANGIPWRDDPAALAIGPTGVALAGNGTLYVANTLLNQITAIPDAMTRTTPAGGGGTPVSTGEHLKQPLGLVIAPNGDIVTANAGDGNLVETTPSGKQVAVVTADKKTGAGSLFGLVIAPRDTGVYFVDDGDNALKLLH